MNSTVSSFLALGGVVAFSVIAGALRRPRQCQHAGMERLGMKVFCSSANGDRPVGVYVPGGFRPGRPVEFALHFHGSDSHVIDEPIGYDSAHYKAGDVTVGANRLKQAIVAIERQSNAGRNAILLYPLSAGRRPKGTYAYGAGYDEAWMQAPEDARSLVRDAEALLGVRVDRLTISGHSAGGAPIANALEAGLRPTRVKFLDASYPNWATRAVAVAAPAGIPVDLHVVAGTRTDEEARLVEGQPGVTVHRPSGLTHGLFVSRI